MTTTTTTTTSISAELARARATLETARAAAIAATPTAPEVLRVRVACPNCGEPGLICEVTIVPRYAGQVGWYAHAPVVVGDECGCGAEIEDPDPDARYESEEALAWTAAEDAAEALLAERAAAIATYWTAHYAAEAARPSCAARHHAKADDGSELCGDCATRDWPAYSASSAAWAACELQACRHGGTGTGRCCYSARVGEEIAQETRRRAAVVAVVRAREAAAAALAEVGRSCEMCARPLTAVDVAESRAVGVCAPCTSWGCW